MTFYKTLVKWLCEINLEKVTIKSLNTKTKSKYLTIIKSIFKKHPHVCKYEFVGYISHFGAAAKIQESIDNPTWYHYPSVKDRQKWLDSGLTKARVYQSHWKCACEQQRIFFFLTIDPNNINIGEVESYNPFVLNSSAGKSLHEVIDEVNNKLF